MLIRNIANKLCSLEYIFKYIFLHSRWLHLDTWIKNTWGFVTNSTNHNSKFYTLKDFRRLQKSTGLGHGFNPEGNLEEGIFNYIISVASPKISGFRFQCHTVAHSHAVCLSRHERVFLKSSLNSSVWLHKDAAVATSEFVKCLPCWMFHVERFGNRSNSAMKRQTTQSHGAGSPSAEGQSAHKSPTLCGLDNCTDPKLPWPPLHRRSKWNV